MCVGGWVGGWVCVWVCVGVWVGLQRDFTHAHCNIRRGYNYWRVAPLLLYTSRSLRQLFDVDYSSKYGVYLWKCSNYYNDGAYPVGFFANAPTLYYHR